MQFIAHCKRKKGPNSNQTTISPFPQIPDAVEAQIRGKFTGISVELADSRDFAALYEHGFYGKGSKSRGGPLQNNESLVLSLEEACFLSYVLQVLCILDYNDTRICFQDFISAAQLVQPNFVLHMAGYLYLKSKNWIIKSGIKFGGDYLIYKRGPRNYHASFLVIISTPGETNYYAAKDIKGLQRIAETSDKDVLLLDIVQPTNFKLGALEDFENMRVTETIIRRFNYTGFVQQNQQTNTK